jgi:hypothetical protein
VNLARVRWAIRAVLALGVAASTAANILHAADNPISQAIAAWPPLALLITIEVVARVPVHRRSLAVARRLAATVIAAIAAWVSYWHMAGVAVRYGETGASAYLLPLSVDGLVLVASICLVELSGHPVNNPVNVLSAPDSQPDKPQAAPPVVSVPDGGPLAVPTTTMPATPTATKPPRKPPSAAQRVARAHRQTPTATNQELADRLSVSLRTVERNRPPRQPDTAINGNAPQLSTTP